MNPEQSITDERGVKINVAAVDRASNPLRRLIGSLRDLGLTLRKANKSQRLFNDTVNRLNRLRKLSVQLSCQQVSCCLLPGTGRRRWQATVAFKGFSFTAVANNKRQAIADAGRLLRKTLTDEQKKISMIRIPADGPTQPRVLLTRKP
jgi:hypothetical protein